MMSRSHSTHPHDTYLATLRAALVQAALSGSPGAAYVDIPSNILMASVEDSALVKQALDAVPRAPRAPKVQALAADVAAAVSLLKGAKK